MTRDHNLEPCVLSVDIGGTNSAIALVTREGEIVRRGKLPTRPEEPAAQLVQRVVNAVAEMLPDHELAACLQGVGIGAPNGNYYTGEVISPPNLSWGRINLVELFQQHYSVPGRLTNDANAAALGELYFGAARGMKHFVEITLGTGLGSGLVVDGKLVFGADGLAGELGHTIIRRPGRPCKCGLSGCLETYVSAPGLVLTVREMLAQQSTSSSLAQLPAEELTAVAVHNAAEQGDELAARAFSETGQLLGEALATTAAHLRPEAFILFGGLVNAGHWLLEPVREHLNRNVLPIWRDQVRVLVSTLPGDDAALLGCAALIWDELPGELR